VIAKVPARRNDGRSSFGTLAHYIAGDKLERTTGEILRSSADVQCETNCLSLRTASAEMRAAAEANGRVKDPVYHCVISWREGEQPTDQQAFAAAAAAQKSLGMEGHQYVFAIHRDTDNTHVHMMLNRVHPQTSAAVYPMRDFLTLDKCMREVELAQGWQHDAGPHSVRDGKIVRQRKGADQAPGLPTAARDFETFAGGQSLAGYAQSVAPEVVAALDQAATWQTLHSELKRRGLEIREAGQGFKIYSVGDDKQTPIKASDMSDALGGGKLKKRLGDFQAPDKTVADTIKPERVYQRDPAEREQRRAERAAARAVLKEQYKNECREHRAAAGGRDAKAEYARLRAEARATRDRIRSEGYDKTATKYLLSIAAMEAVQKREALKKSLKEERAGKRPPSYQQWVASRAEAGDAGAISQLKGWQYQDTRKRKAAEKAAAEEAANGSLRGNGNGEPAIEEITTGIRWSVNKSTGDVTYHAAGRELLCDTGRQVSVLDQQSDQAITAGLMLARQKFGGELTLTGPAEFQKRAVEIAVQQRMQIQFLDPAAEQYRQQLIQQHQEQKNGTERATTETPASPPSIGSSTGSAAVPDVRTGNVVNQKRPAAPTANRSVLRGNTLDRVDKQNNGGRGGR